MNRLLVGLCLLVSLPLMAQQRDFIGRTELLFCGGGMNYIGDLNNQSVFGRVHAAYGFGMRCHLDNRWALTGRVNKGEISGGDPDWIELRNLSFRSEIFEVSVVGEFSFWPYGQGSIDHQWTPYIFGGLGLFHFNPMAHYAVGNGDEVWVELQPLHTEGQGTVQYPDRKPYTLTHLCMPFGIGFRWRLGKTFSLSAEYGFRKTWTDYIDDVSTTYVGADLLTESSPDGALAAILADRSFEVRDGYVNAVGIKRGDDSLDDMYSYFHISLGVSLETLLGWMRPKRCKL